MTPPVRGRPRGYVLLIVLLLLAMAGVGLAATCRLTLRRSLAAHEAAADLQHHWGVVTAQYALLADAANVMDRSEVDGEPVAPTLHGSVQLGGQRFDVNLCDDQARANVNALLAWRGQAAATAALHDLTRATPRLPADPGRHPPRAVSTTPDADVTPDDPATTDRVPPRFGSLTEVFPSAGWDQLWPSAPGRLSATVTAFGSGQVNVRRASPAVIAAACGPALSPAQAATLSRRARAAGPTFDVPSTLASLGTTAAAASSVQSRLVDGSFTQSVWIEAHDGRRTWRSWAARDATDAEHPRTFTGAW